MDEEEASVSGVTTHYIRTKCKSIRTEVVKEKNR